MGLFGKKSKSSLPADIVPQMAKYGQAQWNGETALLQPGPFGRELQALPPDAQRAWVTALSEAVVPVGGWAACGAAQTVMLALAHPVDSPAYRAILDSALDFKRSACVWQSQLSPNEVVYWQMYHQEEPWLPRKNPPARETALITALPVGQERKIAVMSKRYEVYASQPEPGNYVSLVERPGDDGPDREQGETAPNLFDLYWKLGQAMPWPNTWVDSELEPFIPFPSPRI